MSKSPTEYRKDARKRAGRKEIKLSEKPTECVYLVRCGDFNLYKIGKSIAGTIKYGRLVTLQGGCPFELTLIGEIITNQALDLEKQLHKQFWKNRYRGEWFYLTDSQIEEILQIFK